MSVLRELTLPERILLGYLGYVLVLAGIRPITLSSRKRVAVLALLFATLIVMVSRIPLSTPSWTIRAILPLAGILGCYYLSGAFFTAPQPAIEAQFQAFDRRLRRWIGVHDVDRRAPRAVLELLELAYLACYAVPLAGFLVVIAADHRPLVDRYWSIVVLSVVVCYGMLPWIRTRPGWALSSDPAVDRRRLFMRTINRFLVRHTSIRHNTFPSGHVAAAVATTLALTSIVPQAVPVFLLVALAIAAGSVIGDYHYAGDAIAGAITAVAAWALVIAWGA